MPALITDSTTNNQTGEISVSDVRKTINDYITKVNLNCTDPTRNPVLKHFDFTIDLSKIQSMIDMTSNALANTFRINLTLNLPNQLTCHNEYSIENYLSILVCCVDKSNETHASLLNVGDYILAEGFQEYGNAVPDCCVQGNPPSD